MHKVSNWDKFKLLLWKNWVLQWNNKWQLAVELLLPVVFAMLLVLVRRLVVPEPMPEVHYPPLSIADMKVFKHFLALARRGQVLLKTFLPKASQNAGLNNPIRFPDLKLLYSPNTSPDYDAIIKSASESLNIEAPVAFANADDLNHALTTGNYLAGVEFDASAPYPHKFSYALRFPSELRTGSLNIIMTWLTMKLFLPFGVSGPRNLNETDGGIPVGYLREGFLPIQHAISAAYIKRASGGKTLPDVQLQRFPYPAYIFDPLLSGLAPIMSLIIILSFTYPCTYITKYITAEKEKQLKEIMKIMGLQNWIHWAAWFVKSFIMLGISSVLIVLLMKINWAYDVSVLTHSSFTALLFFLLIYVTTSICFCFMLATIFSKASTAAAVTGLLWFIAHIPFSLTLNTYDQLSLADKLGLSLLSNTAMGFGFKVILSWEGSGEGLQWGNIWSPVSVDDSLSLGLIMLMMLVTSVLYMLICLYLEQIFPGEYGVPRKWYFPLSAKFWCGQREYGGAGGVDAYQPNGTERSPNPNAFEPEPTGRQVGLQVKNLKKKFGGKFAVKDLSMSMYENEITVLLGHNGAGKTTTISMLTGIYPPTAGTAIINGSDIRSNMEGARLSMGICPQHNVLFDSLTVANHIEFFSRLKGLKGEAVRNEVKKYLSVINLEDKENVASSKLSGGMKRKLSICCALCGGTKVVLCDEPSSGMDPAARRQLWDLLQSEKSGRTMLLTTHFMDEADVLGDRIAIMCEGELKCMGTSFFLKKKYGSGYRLICVKLENCISQEVTALLNRFIPGIKPVSDVGAELSYALPDSYTPIFEKMFRTLEDNSDRLKLNGYGVSITSLEEVFMKVGVENGNEAEGRNATADVNGDGARYAEEDLESVHSGQAFSEKSNLLRGVKLCLHQWHAMFLKKFLYTLRNKLLFFIQNFMPIIFVVITIVIADKRGTFRALKPMTISLTQYPASVSVLERDASLNGLEANAPEVRIADQYKALVKSYAPAHQFESTGARSFADYIINLGQSRQVRINSRYVAAATVAKGKITAWLNNQPLHTAPLTVNMVHNAMARALVHPDAEITVTNAPLPYTPESKIAQLNVGQTVGTQLATNLCFCFCFVTGFYILFLIRERESRSKLLQFVSGVNVWTFWLTQLLWDMVTFGLTAVIVIATIACFQEEGFSQLTELARYFLMLIIFGFSALPLTYLMSLLFSEPATGFARVSTFNILTGMALFMVVFVMSFEVFDTKETADQLQWFLRIFPHFSLALSLNKLNANSALRKACSNAIVEALPDSLRCQMVPKCCKTTPFFDWLEPGILPEIVYLLVTAVVFFMALIILEYGIFHGPIYRINRLRRKPLTSPSTDAENDDVTAEKQRILKMSKDEIANQNLVLDRVSKRYKNFVAVNEISMCVKSNECFGLLGVNGAGKTSTFKMLTGDVGISSGAVYVKGLSLATDMNEINKEIGYCPQFDALLDDLTGRETLKVFCLLRGVRKNEIPKLCEELSRSFGFIKHMDKQTRAYSGGNKRKLSVALAIIGSPSVIYLDEPTTGMDPASRRRLWNMVCRIRDSGKSIVLTSHSMEECEALCTRLAIMVNGVFKCIGSTQHLKNKFSKGLILKIKVKRHEALMKKKDAAHNVNASSNDDEHSRAQQQAENDTQNIKSFIQEKFIAAVLKEEHQCILTFHIPLVSIRWSTIFGLMESNREKLNIEDYSISQTTLEEIFLEFAKSQRSTQDK